MRVTVLSCKIHSAIWYFLTHHMIVYTCSYVSVNIDDDEKQYECSFDSQNFDIITDMLDIDNISPHILVSVL